MLSFLLHKGDCTGCTACKAICPVQCITMHTDEEGFWYPVSSDACVNCGRCEKVCPVNNSDKTANYSEQNAYACLTKDDKIWKRSASGGAFSEICLAWGDDKTIIVGAAWDGFKVHHVCVEGVYNITQLCKSKYIASYPENTFREIRDYLRQGRKVIFCGVPCQVAGLRSFLSKDYENLLTIDLICHGVGSPKVFESAIQVIEEQIGEKIDSYEFRAKRKQFELEYLSSVKKGHQTKYLISDPYMQLFLHQNCLRPSCGRNCKFRNKNRQGDLTIADFKGLTKVFPQLLGTKHNYSSIVSNSEKGNGIIPLLYRRMIVLQCDISEIGKYNPLFERQTFFSEDRDLFFKEFEKEREDTIKRWTKPTTFYIKSYKAMIFDILPVWLRRMYLKLKER